MTIGGNLRCVASLLGGKPALCRKVSAPLSQDSGTLIYEMVLLDKFTHELEVLRISKSTKTVTLPGPSGLLNH